MSAAAVPLNPFSDQIVTSPGRTEPSVRGLNDAVLRRLLAEFERVEAAPRICGRAQLVISPAGGYGKSHLIGRLFKDLGRRATRIYVRPFSDPESCWVSLLHNLVQDLTAPEFPEGTGRPGHQPTQLDGLAHGVFGALLVALLDAGEFEYSDPEFVRERLLRRTFEKWDMGDPQSHWGVWAGEMIDSYEQRAGRQARLVSLLEDAAGRFHGSTTRPGAWLSVLRRYARNRSDKETRSLVLEWLRARLPRLEETTAPLGLTVTDGADAGLGPAARNALARTRVLEIMALAKLFRPFVLCFDQTEVFARVPGLARAFGCVLSDLVQGEGAHLTVVTANLDVWESELVPQMERADSDRIAPRLEMLGLTQEQGRGLATQRLQQTRLPASLQGEVLSHDWLEEQFRLGLLPPREFLRRCERRYEQVVPDAPAQPAKPEMMLVELFSRECRRLIDDPAELETWRADVLRWALLDVPARSSGAFKVAAHRSDLPSFAVEWEGPDERRWVFILEESSNAIIWRTLTARAVDLRRRHAKTTAIALRLSGQPELPSPAWGMVGPEMEEAIERGTLRLVTVQHGDLARIHAGWELYAQACQGDIPHEPDSVMRFIAQRLQAWHTSLRGGRIAASPQDGLQPGEILPPISEAEAQPAVAEPLAAAPAPEEPTMALVVLPESASSEPVAASNGHGDLAEALRQIISSRRFASYVEIADELRTHTGRDITVDEACRVAEATGEIRVYAQGTNAGFLWQGW